LHNLAAVAKSLGKTARAALRVNPDLPPKTHIKTDTSVKGVKFGLDIDTILDVARGVLNKDGIEVVGLHMHLGSPILDPKPYREGAAKGVRLIAELRKMGHPISILNMGGGFGITIANRRRSRRRPSPRSSCRRSRRPAAGWCWSRGASSSATPAR